MRARRGLSATCLGILLSAQACSTSEARRPCDGARATLASLRAISEVAGHLGDGGTLRVEGAMATRAPRRAYGGFSPVSDPLEVQLPLDARGPLRIGVGGHDDLFVSIRDVDAIASTGEIVEGALVHHDAAVATHVVRTLEADRLEEIRILRSPTAAARTVQRVELGPAIASIGSPDGAHLEVMDRLGQVVLRTLPMIAIDARGARRTPRVRVVERDGWTIETSLDTDGLTHPIVIDPVWTPVGDTKRAHRNHGAIAVAPTKVLAIGGFGLYAPGNVELYDAGTRKWSTVDSMKWARELFPALMLPSGEVLVEGGYTYAYTEIYDPLADKWSEVAPMSVARFAHNAATLLDGSVIVIGGTPDNVAPAWSTVERFDPTARTWSSRASMIGARFFHATATLPDGRVLVAGGMTRTETLSTVEIYDPGKNVWSAGPPLSARRTRPATAVLASGAFLVTGGLDGSGNAVSTAELFDPKSSTWTTVKPMSVARSFHTATKLGSGRVLVAGGEAAGVTHSSSEVYDPSTGNWSSAGAMTVPRILHSATLLGDGSVLVVGGGVTPTLASSELFTVVGVGQPCGGDAGCTSDHCVDGICCATACTGSCEACDVVGSAGSCVAITAGPVHPSHSCGAYGRCVAGACASSCTTSGECATAFHCSEGKCVPRGKNGEVCKAADECVSGFCVDGICCDSICGSACEACDLPEKPGVCSLVRGAPHGSRAPCGDGSPCSSTCLGAAKTCAFPEAGAPCGPACSDPTSVIARQCDGAGACLQAGDSKSCDSGEICKDGACAPREPEPEKREAPQALYSCGTNTRGGSPGSIVVLPLVALVLRKRRARHR